MWESKQTNTVDAIVHVAIKRPYNCEYYIIAQAIMARRFTPLIQKLYSIYLRVLPEPPGVVIVVGLVFKRLGFPRVYPL